MNVKGPFEIRWGVDGQVSDHQNGADVEAGVGSDEECSLADSPGVVCSGPGRWRCILV